MRARHRARRGREVKAQIARALGCSRKSLYLWMRVHPEFKEAMDEAEFAALAWWEDVGQAGLTLVSPRP